MAEAQTKTMKDEEQEKQLEQQQMEDEMNDLQAFEPQRSIYDRIREQVERFATTTLGQYVIVRGDRALKAIENTAKWSVPQEKSSCPLERPLPWLPFLFLIVLLRLIRVWLSVGALMIGNGPVSAADMVYFFQVRRRKLRAIRVHGLKTRNLREQESLTRRSSSSAHSLAAKLRDLLSQAVCQPGLRQDATGNHVFVMRSGVWSEPAQLLTSVKSASKRAADADDDGDDGDNDDVDVECVEHNLTLEQMLAKYANENSEDDSDFVPDEHSDDTSSLESDSDVSEDGQQENGLNKDAKKPEIETSHNRSITIKENGTRPLIMPKPLIEIKNEPISDVDSASEQTMHKSAKERQSQSVVGNGNAHDNAHTPNHCTLNANADQNVEQKSTPGHVSAAAVNTCLFSNTAAAATTDKHEHAFQHENETEHAPNVYHNTEHIYTDSEPVAHSPPPVSRIPVPVIQNDSTLSATLFAAKGVLSINAKPTLDTLDCSTLTPATSTEDIFYSPIGSPIEYNASFLPPSILKNTALPSVGVNAHSLPNGELETVEHELPIKKHVTLPQQQQQQNNKQQQHQQNNHNRYRGRNRR